MEDRDDVDDVDWEGGDSEEECLDVNGEETPLDNAISIAITVGPDSDKKVKKAAKANSLKRVTFTEEDYQVCIERCQEDLDKKLSLGLNLSLGASSELITSKTLNLIPIELTSLGQYTRRFDQWIAMIRWMKATFRTVSTKDMTVEEGRDGSFAADLDQFVMKNKAGSSHQLNQIFVAIMLNLNYRVRLVSTVDLVSCSPQEHADLYKSRWVSAQGENTGAVFRERKYAKPAEKFSWLEVFYEPLSVSASAPPPAVKVAPVVDLDQEEEEVAAVVDLTADTETPSAPLRATSVPTTYTATSAASSAPEKARWVHVDPVHQRIDLPSHVEGVLRKGRPLQYVLAFELSTSPSQDLSSASHADISKSGSKGGCVVRRVKVVDVTSTYKLQHHYATRRDRETHALLDSYLTSSIQQINEDNSSNHTPMALTSSSQPSQSSVLQPFDLMTDEEVDEVVDLTDDFDGPPPRHGNDVDSFNPASSSSSDRKRNSSSSQQYTNYAEYTDYTDYDFVDSTDKSQTSSSSSSKRQRSASPSTSHTEEFTATSSDELRAKHPLPGKFQDFKDHPVYLLERHVLSEQALHPGALAVGVFKGETVYMQKHKETLRTKLQWRRCLKQVRRGEESIKVVQRSVRVQNNDGGSEGGGDGNKTLELKLFGSWQTEKIEIKPIIDGIIPMNSHGNIEVWEGRADFVPAGAVYLDNPSAIKTARSLELPCAPAVVGFEHRGLYNVPIIGGVVVLRQHAAIVQDASYFVDAVREESVYLKRDREMTAKWERLAHGMLSRQRLREKYGH